MPLLRQMVWPGILGLALAVLSPVTPAQSSQSQNPSIDEQPLVRLENTRHPLAIEANATGPVEGGRVLRRMLLVLSPGAEKEDALKTLIDLQHTRTSPQYHHWLTAAEFGARFGAADADLEKVRGWLEGAGFTVEPARESKRTLEFSGTVEQVEGAFHTKMKYYRVNGRIYLANATDLAVPAELSGITRGVVSLNNFGKRAPIENAGRSAGQSAAGTKTEVAASRTATGTPDSFYNAPGDFAAIYNTKGLLNSGIDGTGVAIAVTAQSDIELTDVRQFRRIFDLKTNDPKIYLSGPDPGIASPADSEEAKLDVEWAGAVAPGATIDLVLAASTDTTSGVDLAAIDAIDNELAPIVTYTYGACESALGTSGNAFYNALWGQAAAEGITVLVASGDNGSAGCDSPNAGAPAALGFAVNGVASTPYNVAVGGTQFADASKPSGDRNGTNTAEDASAVGYKPETAWKESCDPGEAASATNCPLESANFSLLASGGGPSAVYRKPLWQSGTGVPADNARDLPDVALVAASLHDQAVFCTSLEGTPCQRNADEEAKGLTRVGGTSASTPAMAGILALVEQKNGTFQGQINYVLYRLAETKGNRCDSSAESHPETPNSCVFYDVTTGGSGVPCAGGSPGCSSAQNGTSGFMTGNVPGPGYDLVTGLGSVNATNLADAWENGSLAAAKSTPQVKLVIPVSASPDEEVSLDASVSGEPGNSELPSPTGIVEFWDSLDGGAAQLLTVESLTVGAEGNGTYRARCKLATGSHNLYVHYRGDTHWQAANSVAVPLDAATFSLGVSPNPIAMTAGSPGVGTVSVSPGGGFAGTVTLTCASGGTFLPAGYACSFGNAQLPVNGGVATTPITFTPSSTATGAVKSASLVRDGRLLWGMASGAGLLLLGFLGLGGGEAGKSRNFLLAAGFMVCVSSCVLGCGGGGGGSGGGPVPTSTTLLSNNLRAPFGTPVTFTVTVKPNGPATPSGLVQLYDNGQAFLSAVKVNAGIATFQATTLPVGVHNLSAQYLGDATTQGSTSAPIMQVITGQIALQISGVSGATTEVVNFNVVVN